MTIKASKSFLLLNRNTIHICNPCYFPQLLIYHCQHEQELAQWGSPGRGGEAWNIWGRWHDDNEECFAISGKRKTSFEGFRWSRNKEQVER